MTSNQTPEIIIISRFYSASPGTRFGTQFKSNKKKFEIHRRLSSMHKIVYANGMELNGRNAKKRTNAYTEYTKGCKWERHTHRQKEKDKIVRATIFWHMKCKNHEVWNSLSRYFSVEQKKPSSQKCECRTMWMRFVCECVVFLWIGRIWFICSRAETKFNSIRLHRIGLDLPF